MPSSVPARSATAAIATSSEAPGAGSRLTILSAYAIAAYAVPLPFLPDRALTRIRGAVIQDVASRHGLSLTTDAREILAAPTKDHGSTVLIRRAIEIARRKLLSGFGPLGMLSPVVRGLEVYTLGHLLDRYIETVREAGAVRIHADEARKLRTLIDRALLHAASPSLSPASVTQQGASEDLRDEFTRWIDTILLVSASLPSYIERRIDAAFDAIAEQSERERDG